MDYRIFLGFLNRSIGVYNIKGIYVEPTYWMVLIIVFLMFLLLLTLARLRYLYIHWSLNRPALSFLFYGFLLALIFEGFFILGGRTIFTEILGWKEAPKPISTILEIGRHKLVQVLGTSEDIPASQARQNPDYESVISEYQRLSPEEAKRVQDFICRP